MNSCIYLAIVFVVLSSRLSYANEEFRVINGKHIDLKNGAHSAAIFVQNQYRCVGTLVTVKSVVTAANCVYWVLLPSHVAVLAGMVNMRRSYKGTGQKHQAEDILKHPSYTGRSSRDVDIAVVKVVGEFTCNFEVQPKPLCDSVLPDMKMKVSGWGAVDFGEKEPPFLILKTTQMTIMQKDECQNKVMATLNMAVQLPNTIICADGSGSYLGAGDAGAGGIVDDKLCAVAQGGLDRINTPGLFTNVTNERVLTFLKAAITRVEYHPYSTERRIRKHFEMG